MNENETKLAHEVASLSRAVQSLREQVQVILNQIPAVKNDQSKLQSSLLDSKDEGKSHKSEIEKLKALVAAIREEFARNLTSCHDALIKIIEEKFKKLCNVDEAHKDLKESLEKLALQIEGISLDSRNALMKANNNDVLTQLNRKKLENIQLLLKSKELNK